MKKFIMMLAVALCASTGTARADLTFKVVSPIDAAKSIGDFVDDTGEKLCEGLTTTVLGVGEIITSPFRARFNKPKARTYYFDAPKLEIQRGKLYRVRPRAIPLQPKTYEMPTPLRDYNVKHVATK